MKVQVIGKDFKVTDAINDYAERKLERIDKYFEESSAEVVVKSEKNEQISKEIEKKVKRGVTGLYGKGMYSNINKLVLICAASRGDIIKIKTLAKNIDQNCFIIVANAREVLGNGFKEE